HPLFKIFIVFLVIAYVARVLQIRRRKILRRRALRERQRARIETTRRQIDDRYSQRMRDRKSTRMNSSHLVISYAVFCLKNRKEKDEYHRPITSLDIAYQSSFKPCAPPLYNLRDYIEHTVGLNYTDNMLFV